MSSNNLTGAYPDKASERDRWILERRGARRRLDPFKPNAFLVEEERADSGEIVPVATIFLTNRECPWRCLMCDLWSSTLTETVPLGAIPAQIDFALVELSKRRNAGVQPESSEETPVAGPHREQRRSRNMQSTMPTRKIRLRRNSPSPRPSPALPLPSPLTPLPSDGRGEGPGEGESTADGSAFSPPEVRLRSALLAPRRIKLYNSGSFFDPRAIPPEDYAAIAERVRAFERVIVECHPSLVGESVLKFRDLLAGPRAAESKPYSAVEMPLGSGSAFTPARSLRRGRSVATARPISPVPVKPWRAKTSHDGQGTRLELAMGLETAHPEVLEKLNKRMTLEQFRGAAEFLRKNEIALRVFILVKPPFLTESESSHWAERSVDFAFDSGATAISLIPTRSGNGGLDALAVRGEFSPPQLSTLETALDYGIGLRRGRVFADLWDLETFSACSACFEQRRARLLEMNLEQVVLPRVTCTRCRSTQVMAGEPRSRRQCR